MDCLRRIQLQLPAFTMPAVLFLLIIFAVSWNSACHTSTDPEEHAPLVTTTPATSPGETVPMVADFGNVTIGNSKDITVRVTNTSPDTLVDNVTHHCPEFVVISGGSINIPPNESTTFVVRFTPSEEGNDECHLPMAACRPGAWPKYMCRGVGVK